jgi:purine-nucleoside phosphorylase
MLEKINAAVSFIKNQIDFKPEYGIILGTGLGGLVNEIEIKHVLDYSAIPNFPLSTVESHAGKLIFGLLEGKRVMAMQGRFHYYEGYSMQEVTFPVRVMKFLGIKFLFISNASGGVNPEYEKGDVIVITDHINLLPNPLIGKHYEEFGPRFPDMSDTYDKTLIEKALKISEKNNLNIKTGCYVGVTGPSLETPKEYEYFRAIGGDTIGMSTIPEVIAAHQMGIPVFVVSIITDLGIAGKITKVSLSEIVEVANRAEPKMTTLIKKMIIG